MVNLTIPFEALLEVVEKLSQEEKAILRQRLETNGTTAISEERIPNLHPGAMRMHDDFDEPLPDEFWFGEDA